MELQHAFVKPKKKKRNQNEIKPRLLTNIGYDSYIKDSDIDNHLDRSNSITENDIKENIKKSRSLANTDKVKVLTNADPKDLSEFASKSVDVVVDIHREYKEEEESTIEKCGKSQNESKGVQAFSKTNTWREKKAESLKIKLAKQQNRQRNNDDHMKVVDSIDAIGEFTESPVKEKDGNRPVEAIRDNNMLSKRSNTIFEKTLHGRKQWSVSNEEAREEKKPLRKRWSKNTSVIRLPETRGASWTTTPLENKDTLISTSEHALSTRSFLKEKSKNLFGIDNSGFDAENEEIIRIETGNNRGDTRIEMKELFRDTKQHMEVSNFTDRTSENSSSDERNKVFEETAITIEDLNESVNSDERCTEHRKQSAILNVEHIATRNRGEESFEPRTNRGSLNRIKSSAEKSLKIERNLSDNSNGSHGMEELVAKSDNHSSSETTAKSTQNLISKENRRWNKKHTIKDPRCSKEYSTSATEDGDVDASERSIGSSDDDDIENDRSVVSNDEDKLERSSVKKKKSKFTEHQSEMRHKKEKRGRSFRDSVSNSSVSNFNAGEASKKKKKKKTRKKDIKYISVTIHRADMLEVDYVTKHPMVKVHIVRAENGKYLKDVQGSSTYLQPVITGKFDFKENKSIVPVWEEELTFEYDFDEILKTENEQVLMLFEIVDLLSFAEASFSYDKFGHEGCWYKIAWAFLKPVGRNNILHIDKKIRLQLYKPRKKSRKFERFHTCEVYTWWKSNVREKYPSSLFVTVQSVDPPKLEPVFYRQLSLHDLSNARNESHKASTRASDSIHLPKWTRLAAQSCKIPNETVFETETSENGCFYVAFSNDGKYLACSFSEEHDYPIVVYEVETKKIHVRFSGHKTFIYSLNWSNNDNYLLSVSSDQTARVWDIKNQIVQYIEMMPHPSYVYCGKFEPENASIVATGCYDRIVRIWIRNKKSKNRDLGQELEGHEGFINSMCYQRNGDLLTADSVGIIILWIAKKSRRVLSKKEWHISRKIKVREIDGVIINTIVLHPLESRLLVHSRNSGLRMLDLATGVALQKYNDLNNQRIQSTACISPCGGLILCGSEDSSLNVWNLETGSLLAKYTFNRNYRAVTCVDYHPYDHVLAFSTFGSPSPVRILHFNKDAIGDDVGLKIMGRLENTMHNSNVSLKFLNTSATPKIKSRPSNEKEIIDEPLKGRSLQSSRTYDTSRINFFEGVHTENNKYSDARIKLQRLNEAEQSLKSRSANRLYNIIERIDRILSNTSRSSGDIESGRNFTILQESSDDKMLTSLNDNTAEKKNKWGGKSRSYLNMENRSNSNFESSISSSDKQDVLELRTLQNVRRNNWNMKKRSRSAKEGRDKDSMFKDDIAKTFSDSQMNYESIQTDFIVEMIENNGKPSSFHKSNHFKKDDTNSSDSGGTYIVEKSDVKRGGKKSTKILEDKFVSLNDTENDFNIVKNSESESSLLSNATFTIENEIPIPKPRKMKNKSSEKIK